MNKGFIFDIKPYSINDGPGIRITVFLKGCPLNCAWCHNPEGISPQVQKMYSKNKCIGCGTCVEACPVKALELTPEGIVTDFQICDLCGICADVCPTRAMEMSGRTVTIGEIMEIIRRDRVTIDQSGGGVTLSGGEPALQSDFVNELFDACGLEGIHRTLDTAGLVSTETLLEIATRTDLFLYDLKLMDPDKHKQWTGVSNELILKNLRILAEAGANIHIRIPLIRGVNTDERNIRSTAAFVASLPGPTKLVSLLPYHNIAINKYNKLGQQYDLQGMEEPTQDEVAGIIRLFTEYGLKASVGG